MKTRTKVFYWGALVCLITMMVWAANPSFNDFDTSQFAASFSGPGPNGVSVRTGGLFTNESFRGVSGGPAIIIQNVDNGSLCLQALDASSNPVLTISPVAGVDITTFGFPVQFQNGINVTSGGITNAALANATALKADANGAIVAGSGGSGGTNSGPIALSISGTNVAINATTPLGCATNAPLPYRLTLTTNVLMQNPTGMLDGQRVVFELIQDATGGRQAFWDTTFGFGTDITGTALTTTANKRDFVTADYNSTANKWYIVGFVRGY